MLKLFFKLDRGIAHLERAIAITCLATLSGVLIAQIFFRYILRQPLFWAEELALGLMFLMTFIGLSLLIHSGRLVAITPLANYLSPAVSRIVNISVQLIVVFLSGLLAYYAFQYVSNPAVWIERSPTLPIPRATYYTVFGIECVLMSLHQLAVTLGGRSILTIPIPAHAEAST